MTAGAPEHPLKPPAIAPAIIHWVNDEPISSRFNDVYFARENGLAESRAVFLKHNGLHERFRAMPNASHFVVAESGFGTGLNFFVTWQAWQENAPDDAILHFVSFEHHPLTLEDFERASELWPELAPFYQDLLDHYPHPVSGLHRLVFSGGRVRLSLFYGDATAGLQQMRFTADAWYLDGFAPAKNPTIWQHEFIQAVARHSRVGTTLATFTAAGAVRRSLEASGFELDLVAGFGRKREMLRGVFREQASNSTSLPQTRWRPEGTRSNTVTIIGAGIAGLLLARNLAERHLHVRVLGTAKAPADGASGNSQAAVYVKLGVDYGPETAINLAALLHAQRFYGQSLSGATRIDGDQHFWHPTGLLQLATTARERDRQRRFLERNQYPRSLFSPLTAGEASTRAGMSLTAGGLWFPDSGWLDPVATCEWLLDHPRIHFQPGKTVTAINQSGANWQLAFTDESTQCCERIVIAAGHHTPDLLADGGSYRLRPIRGQVTQVPTASIDTPECVICGQGYINPAYRHHTTIGATFDLAGTEHHVTEDDHRENLSILRGFLSQPPPDLPTHDLPTHDLVGRTSFRLATHDYQPVVGEVPAASAPGEVARGLYVFSGLGSKGFALAPLLAEWLADRITGQPESLPLHLSHRLRLSRCRRET